MCLFSDLHSCSSLECLALNIALVFVRCQQSHAHGKEFLGASARVRPHFAGFASSSSKMGNGSSQNKGSTNLENPGPGSYLSIEASYSNACLVANANVKGTNALVRVNSTLFSYYLFLNLLSHCLVLLFLVHIILTVALLLMIAIIRMVHLRRIVSRVWRAFFSMCLRVFFSASLFSLL